MSVDYPSRTGVGDSDCGCGFPVDQNNTRCLILDPDGYMGTYGPCCAPTGKKLEKARRRAAKRLARYRGGGDGGE